MTVLKRDRTLIAKAMSGKASKAWLKSMASVPLEPFQEQLLDAAFPGWKPRRHLDPEDLAAIDDLALAADLAPDQPIESRLAGLLEQLVSRSTEGTMDEPLWRYLDATLPGWDGHQGGKRSAQLRLRATQLHGFRTAAGREPSITSGKPFERTLAGWLQRNRLKHRRGTLAARDENIILGRIGAWTLTQT